MAARRVDATSQAARTAIEDLVELALSFGIGLHPALEIRERHGHISVHARATEGELLIRLPEELLVPVIETAWDGSNDVLRIVRHDPSASAAQRKLAEAHVAVYNATDKIRWASHTLPGIALRRDPAATGAIRLVRPAFANGAGDVAEAFVKTRINQDGCLMPVIDLLDHHPRGAALRARSGAMSIGIEHGGTDTQCFASYGSRRDVLDLALTYGYVDSEVRFAHCLPVTAEIPGLGTVDVVGRRVSPISSLDPPHISVEGNRLSLSHLTFEEGHADRLMAVVHLAVRAFLGRQINSPHNSNEPHNSIDSTRDVLASLVAANAQILQRVESELAESTIDAARVVCAGSRRQRRIMDQVQRDCAQIGAEGSGVSR